jgi:hypothetical protein
MFISRLLQPLFMVPSGLLSLFSKLEPLGARGVEFVLVLVLQHAGVHGEAGGAAGVDHGEGAAEGALCEG